MKVEIHITLKSGVLDPQGKAIEGALSHLGFSNVSNVTQGKYIVLDIAAASAEEAKRSAEAMCEKLLANTVVENYRVDVK